LLQVQPSDELPAQQSVVPELIPGLVHQALEQEGMQQVWPTVHVSAAFQFIILSVVAVTLLAQEAVSEQQFGSATQLEPEQVVHNEATH